MKTMLKFWGLLFGTAVLFFFSLSAFAQDATTAPDFSSLLQQAVGAIGSFKTGAYIAGAIAIVNLLTNLSKLPFLDKFIPARFRPLLALVLGVGTAALGAKVSGASWASAILTGVTTGLGSVGLHELVNVFQAKPAEEIGKVVLAAAAGDAKADAKVQVLQDTLNASATLSPEDQAKALVDWARTHPPVS